MLTRAQQIIEQIAQKTNKVILFHSMSGKDSIVLLHLLYPHFEQITCVFMYVVKDLEQEVPKSKNYTNTTLFGILLYQNRTLGIQTKRKTTPLQPC